MLLREARDLALGSGDCLTALRAVELTIETFDARATQERLDALQALKPGRLQPDQAHAAAEACVIVGSSLARADQLDLALQLWKKAEGFAGRAKSKELAKTAREQTKQIESGMRTRAALGEDPGNPRILAKAGSFDCFVREDWAAGLPLLARGSDARLRDAARLEIEDTSSGAAAVRVADIWWAIADERPKWTAVIRAHAAVLYRQSLPALTGLNKQVAEARIAAANSPSASRAVPVATGKLAGLLLHLTFDHGSLRQHGQEVRFANAGSFGGAATAFGGKPAKGFSRGGGWAFDGDGGYIRYQLPDKALLSAKTLAAWVRLNDVEQAGSGIVTIEHGDTFDSIVYNEQPSGWFFGSEFWHRSGTSKVMERDQTWVHMAITYSPEAYVMYRDGKEIPRLKPRECRNSPLGPRSLLACGIVGGRPVRSTASSTR